jgi:hypothetical protein
MVIRLRRTVLATALLCSTAWAFAADFDGSKALICATVDAHGCNAGEVCIRDLPDSFGVPQFMRIDFANKTIAGPKRTTAIRYIDKSADQVLLQGTELSYAWSVALDKSSGSMVLTLINREDVFVVFGYCISP